ncbi:hypothetical protein JQ597_35045 [Bradyrhizobium sp. AUGA SZCCT0177]|uniref:hypothetical protein n=1 Tax=Bradyrhizobium sp. AUGA SZCCT0177 TaxID=2807665 RepID=UPI001BAA53E3|nr:hypothetical protein [Bradyrhizobium sp. AUGA SZCCT0177]MBR1287285.1 hypothetical protein [Bradyrhizobium sp. AUGA SZCCT0177]
MDINEIDNALHGIEQMLEVAVRSVLTLYRDDADGPFQLAAPDGALLDFSVLDIERRVKDLRGGLISAHRPQGH